MKITKGQLRRLIRESASAGRISSVARKADRLLNEDQTAPKDMKHKSTEEKIEDLKKGDQLYAFMLQHMSKKLNKDQTRLDAANDLVEEFKAAGAAAAQRLTGQWADRRGLDEDEDMAMWNIIMRGMDWKKASAKLVKTAEDVRDAIEQGFEGPVKVPT